MNRKLFLLLFSIVFILSGFYLATSVASAQTLPPELTVSLNADPGIVAPDYPVDIVAAVGGTIPNTDVHYQFYCRETDPEPGFDITAKQNLYSLKDNSQYCFYSSVGTYTAKVHVEYSGWGSLSTADSTVSIRVAPLVIGTLSNYQERDYDSPCTSFGSIFTGKCIDVKINGSDTPSTFSAPASYEVAAVVQAGFFVGNIGNCFLYNQTDKSIIQIYNASNLREIFVGSLWYIKSPVEVSPGKYRHTAVCIRDGTVTLDDQVEVNVIAPTSLPPSQQTLGVSLVANPNSLTLPTGGGSVSTNLTATVTGTAQGNINYTFYCNRPDTGTNVTTPPSDKHDGITDTSRPSACSYSSPGVYITKVIAERGSLAAQDQATVVVNAALSPQKPSGMPTPAVDIKVQ